jgi:hypothetical protein
MFLQVMTFSHDVSGDFVLVRQTHTGDLSESGVRLFRSHGCDLNANSALLRAAAFQIHHLSRQGIEGVHQSWSFTFTLADFSGTANELVNGWHNEEFKRVKKLV